MPATLTPPRPATKRFRERVGKSAAMNVDREAGIIRNVKIIGKHSANGRLYTEEALRNATGLYEGVRVFVNHPTESERGEDRQFEKWAGVLRNVRYREGALFGDLHLRKKTPMFDQICEAAESFHSAFGLSHCADGDSHIDRDGCVIIDAITIVDSVDIVCRPATTSGLFESAQNDDSQQNVETLLDAAKAIRKSVALVFGGDENADKYLGTLVDLLTDLADGGATAREMTASESRRIATIESFREFHDEAADLQDGGLTDSEIFAELIMDKRCVSPRFARNWLNHR